MVWGDTASQGAEVEEEEISELSMLQLDVPHNGHFEVLRPEVCTVSKEACRGKRDLLRIKRDLRHIGIPERRLERLRSMIKADAFNCCWFQLQDKSSKVSASVL